MADEADIANALADAQLASHLALHQKAVAASALVARGTCHYCDEEVGPKAHFCDGPDCRRDWEAEQAILRRQGRQTMPSFAAA